MFELTDAALQELNAYFDGQDKSAIRVYLAPGGCSGPRLALALDEPREEDSVFNDKGYVFCVNSELMENAKNITVDFSPMGFVVNSQLQLDTGGGCGGCTGCGSA